MVLLQSTRNYNIFTEVLYPFNYLFQRTLTIDMNLLRKSLLLFCFSLLTFPVFIGCGYSSDSLYHPGKTISVPVFQNKTQWRELETGVTDVVTRRILQNTPYKLGDPEKADLVLLGEITDFNRPRISEDRSDRVVLSSVSYNVELTLKNPHTDECIFRRSNSFRAEFTGSVGENTTSARQEAQEKIGRWVLKQLEKDPWTAPETKKEQQKEEDDDETKCPSP